MVSGVAFIIPKQKLKALSALWEVTELQLVAAPLSRVLCEDTGDTGTPSHVGWMCTVRKQ